MGEQFGPFLRRPSAHSRPFVHPSNPSNSAHLPFEMNHKNSLKSNKSTTGGSAKLRFRDTFLNLLGEFVALNKSPEVRLSSSSQQFLAEAVREEKRRMSNEFKAPRHVRSASSNAALLRTPAVSTDPSPPSFDALHSRRTSLPAGPAPLASSGRFSLFPPRLRRVAQADERIRNEMNAKRRTSVISESDEEAVGEDPAVKMGRSHKAGVASYAL